MVVDQAYSTKSKSTDFATKLHISAKSLRGNEQIALTRNCCHKDETKTVRVMLLFLGILRT